MSEIYLKTEEILLKQGKFFISLELDRIKNVLSLLGNPQEKIKIIHIAGTNGKGSVSAMLSQIFIEQGYKVGLYTSPHLIKYNERIKINNDTISDTDFYELTKQINDLAEKNKMHLTEFEILTAVMYYYFYINKVDYAIVEVGLGGRFDATNCVENPLLSIITSISFDHTDRLGKTIEKIAFEKAGIIKKDVPVIFDKNNLGAKILSEVSEQVHSPVYNPAECKIKYDKNINYAVLQDKTYELSLLGKYQGKNVSLVLCAVDLLKKSGITIDEKSVKNALKKVKWPCRFEVLENKNIILDGCHNPDGAKLLKESLDFYFPYPQKRIFVYTSLKNKDYKSVQQNLFTKSDLIYHFDMKAENFISKTDIDMTIGSLDVKGLKELINAKKQEDLLIICGSLYALGNILGKIDLCS